jgi:RNA polymerase sigma-70 factor (ECF subfamily)
MVDDLELMNRMVEGDREALKEVYDRYSPKVFTMAIHHLKDRFAAEDITQEIFITVYDKAFQFKGNSKLSTWIYRIAFNKCMDVLKKGRLDSQRQGSVNLDMLYQENISESEKYNLEEILMAIDQLNEAQKNAFILVYLDRIPQKEVAEILGMTLKGLESLIYRSRMKLQKILTKKEGFNP